MKINLTSHIKDKLIQLFIGAIIVLMLILYYKLELTPFPYHNYKIAVSLFKKYDAELNETLVLTRFGIIRQYDAIVASLEGLYSTLDLLKQDLQGTPNAVLSKQLAITQSYLNKKDSMVTEFKRLNPVLINATHDFSTILVDIIDTETQADIVERFSIKNYNPEHSEFLTKLNLLFKDMLTYTSTPTDTLYKSLTELVKTIKQNPLKVDQIDLVIQYAETILSYKPKIMELGRTLLLFPISEEIDKLYNLYETVYLESNNQKNYYQYFFYALSILLLGIVHFAFKRLQNIVQALDESNQKLEQRVLQRTKDLASKNEVLNKTMEHLHEAQDQLIVQEKMASVGMLTTGIAHEIKNPLNFINNFSEMSTELALELKTSLEKEKKQLSQDSYALLYELSNDLEANCQKIHDYGKRADNIINSMLMHSKESSAEKERIDIYHLLNSATDLAIYSYKTNNPQFNAKIEKIFHSQLTQILGAPPALSQTIVSILSNACWALDEKAKLSLPTPFSPLIRITTSEKDGFAIIKFFDNGIGIPEKNIMKIFEPFFTTQPTGLGHTGLGLSIAYDIITKQHKGELSVVSIFGQSTEFTIKIPITSEKK